MAQELQRVVTNDAGATAEEPKKKKGKPRGRPITKETAPQMQLRATAARQARAMMRHKMLRDSKDRIYDLFKEAMAEVNVEKLDFVLKASKLVGLEFAQSPEYVQKTEVVEEVKAKVDSKIEFVLAPTAEPVEIDKPGE